MLSVKGQKGLITEDRNCYNFIACVLSELLFVHYGKKLELNYISIVASFCGPPLSQCAFLFAKWLKDIAHGHLGCFVTATASSKPQHLLDDSILVST